MASSDVGIGARTAIAESGSCQGGSKDMYPTTPARPLKSKIFKSRSPFASCYCGYDCAILNTGIYSIDRGVRTDPSKRQGPICHEKKLISILKLV